MVLSTTPTVESSMYSKMERMVLRNFFTKKKKKKEKRTEIISRTLHPCCATRMTVTFLILHMERKKVVRSIADIRAHLTCLSNVQKINF